MSNLTNVHNWGNHHENQDIEHFHYSFFPFPGNPHSELLRTTDQLSVTVILLPLEFYVSGLKTVDSLHFLVFSYSIILLRLFCFRVVFHYMAYILGFVNLFTS